MSPVSERVLDASPPVGDDREARSLILAALARLKDGQSGVSPRLAQRVAPSPAMSTDAAEERETKFFSRLRRRPVSKGSLSQPASF